MSEAKNSVHPLVVPAVGDWYDHATGRYEVDWVCGCGDHDDGEPSVGLRGDAMTWTGAISQLSDAGFERHNSALTCGEAVPSNGVVGG
jgi:hypothetical protein